MVAAPDTVSFGVNDIRGRLEHSVAGLGHDPRMPTGRATCDLSPATVMGPV
jgi:hypothetical protein